MALGVRRAGRASQRQLESGSNVSTENLISQNLLPVLEALITEASVSGAAERLDMTQSAVSHALRRLRLYFNDPLFVRSANRMLPTPRLQALEPFIRMTMEGLRTHLDPSSEFDPSKSSRNFTVSSSDLGELVFLPAILGELRRQASRCRVRVVSIKPREIKGALERGDVDLLIGSQRLRREGLRCSNCRIYCV